MTIDPIILDVIKSNASTAWDQRGAYSSPGHAFDAYLTNVFDTLADQEYGCKAWEGFGGQVWDAYRVEFSEVSGLPMTQCFSSESVNRAARRAGLLPAPRSADELIDERC